MRIAAAGRARVCSQCGPTASVMSQAIKNVKPVAAQISPARSRWKLCTFRGEGSAVVRARNCRASAKTAVQTAIAAALSATIGVHLIDELPPGLGSAARHLAVNQRHGSIRRIVTLPCALEGLLQLADAAHLAVKI